MSDLYPLRTDMDNCLGRPNAAEQMFLSCRLSSILSSICASGAGACHVAHGWVLIR